MLDPRALLIAALIFIPIERITALRKEQKTLRKHWKNDVATYMINKVIIGFALVAIFGLFLGSLRGLLPGGLEEAILSQPLWLQVIEVMLITDTGYYFAHRAFHTFPVLWKFHAIHHSSEEMDWLAAYRNHPLDLTISKTAALLPVFVLGFSGAAIIIYAFIYQWLSVFQHANTRIGFGPLKWIIASPQFHHWHHANEPAAYNSNFAAQSPLIDMVFGTLYMPAGKMPPKYGIDDKVPALYHQQFVYPFLRQDEEPETDPVGHTQAQLEPNDAQT